MPRALALALLVIVVCGGACGGAKPRPTPTDTVTMTLVVHAREDTNDGRPLHALVRAVDMETYLADSYEQVAALVHHKDDSVLATFVIFPGRTQTIEVEASSKTPVAIYFLFTRPGERWKALLQPRMDKVPESILIELSLRERHLAMR